MKFQKLAFYKHCNSFILVFLNSSGVKLKFGVVSVDLDAIVEEAKRKGPEYRFNVLKPVEAAVSAGFKHVELELDAFYVIPDSLNDRVRSRLLQLKEGGISFTAHLPIWAIELSWLNEHVRKASVASIIESIKMMEFLEPMYYVLHATGDQASKLYRELKRKSGAKFLLLPLFEKASESLEEIICGAEIEPRRIACETVEFPLDLTVALAEEHDLSFLVDTGHILSGQPGTTDLLGVVKRVKDRLVGFHLHDGYYRSTGDGVESKSHLPLGKGDMPVKEFFQLLKDYGFKGPLVFELPLKEALESIEYIRRKVPDLLF